MKYKWLYIIVGLMILIFACLSLFPGKKVEYVEFTIQRATRGNLEASVVMVEWSDFECPACGAAYQVVEDVYNTYQDKIKFEYRHFPLSYHKHAYQAAVASECANDQGKFWEYYNKLFQNQNKLSSSDLKKYSQEIGLDQELFTDCLASEVKKKIVEADLAEANRLALNFTPSIFINGRLIEDWTKLELMVKELIEPVAAAKSQSNNGTIIQ